MKYDLVQLIKDRMPCLEENEVVCKLLDYFLKDIYSSDLFILADDRIVLEDGSSMTIYNYDHIEIVKGNEEIGVEEDIRFNIIDTNSFDIFYCNYDVNGNKPLVKKRSMKLEKDDKLTKEFTDAISNITRDEIKKNYLTTIIKGIANDLNIRYSHSLYTRAYNYFTGNSSEARVFLKDKFND